MPLKSGSSKETISSNISELYHANASKSPDKKRGRAQIIAIAMANARKSKGKKSSGY
jgi:hypothetical protein